MKRRPFPVLKLGLTSEPCVMSALGGVPPSEYCSKKTLTDYITCPSGHLAESSCLLTAPPAGQVWEQQLHPHLRRNQQLQDVLLQREEELLQLQEENWKLREFLSSSVVKNLEVQAKKLSVEGRSSVTRELKRNAAATAEGPFQKRQRPPPQQISKRVCRNLSELQASPEPALDLWVLRMLGLEDCDTIEPSPSSSSSPGCSLESLVHISPSNTRPHPRLNSYSNSLSTPGAPAKSPQNFSVSPSPSSDLVASGLSRLSEAPEAIIMSSCPSTAFQSPAEEPGFRRPSARPGVCSREPAACWSPLDRNQDSPLAGEGPLSPSSSSPVKEQWRCGCSSGRPSGGCWIPADPPAAVVFSMSLSPSCSVRTHSFAQGQAFVRKNPEGSWNFTWVPRQGP